MTTQVRRYTEQADEFLRQAEEEFQRGDLRQAAEKGWGAAAQTLKSIAELRGWDHYAHWHLGDTISRLSEERPNAGLLRGFSAAESLHRFFYESGLSRNAVRYYLDDVRTLVEGLRTLLP